MVLKRTQAEEIKEGKTYRCGQKGHRRKVLERKGQRIKVLTLDGRRKNSVKYSTIWGFACHVNQFESQQDKLKGVKNANSS